MCVNQRASIFVAHSSLELIDPDTRIDCKRFPFDSLEPESRQRLRSLKPWKTQRTHGTGRPTGAKRLHRDFTPIFQLQGNKCECISTAMTVTVKCRLTRETRYYVTQIRAHKSIHLCTDRYRNLPHKTHNLLCKKITKSVSYDDLIN